MGHHEPCPDWCHRHTAARCRSTAEVVTWRSGPVTGEIAAQLEQWHGRELALVLLTEMAAPIYLPRTAAVRFGTAVGGLLDVAG